MEYTKNHVRKWLVKHREIVSAKMSHIANDLAANGRRHDNSYTDDTEAELFIKVLNSKSETEKQRHMDVLDGLHNHRNMYHPVFFEGDIRKMNLLDLIQYVCDSMSRCEEYVGGTPKFDYYCDFLDKTLKLSSNVTDDMLASLHETIRYILDRDGVLKERLAQAPAATEENVENKEE